MKHAYSILGAALLTLSSASATVTFSTTSAVGLKQNDGITNIASGSLVLLVVDSTGNGFLNTGDGGLTASATGISSALDPGLTAAQVSTTTGEFFGGDLILGSFSASGGGSVALALTNVSIAGFESMPFALVWFQDTAANLASSTAGEFYGIASGDDWTLPASDSGAYTFNATTNTTTSVYWQLANATSAAQIGTNGFFTGTGTAGTDAVKVANFQVVPEPSAALLGAIGMLGLLRRRRA